MRQNILCEYCGHNNIQVETFKGEPAKNNHRAAFTCTRCARQNIGELNIRQSTDLKTGNALKEIKYYIVRR